MYQLRERGSDGERERLIGESELTAKERQPCTVSRERRLVTGGKVL